MKRTVIYTRLLLIAHAIFAQTDKKNEPDVQYRVKKEYDENGNLNQYDSVYTYNYSGGLNGTSLDSLMEQFNSNDFNFNFPFDQTRPGGHFQYDHHDRIPMEENDSIQLQNEYYIPDKNTGSSNKI